MFKVNFFFRGPQSFLRIFSIFDTAVSGNILVALSAAVNTDAFLPAKINFEKSVSENRGFPVKKFPGTRPGFSAPKNRFESV